MKAFVVMSNDFPDSVFATETAAEEYVAEKLEKQRLQKTGGNFFGAHIHWRYYEFDVRR